MRLLIGLYLFTVACLLWTACGNNRSSRPCGAGQQFCPLAVTCCPEWTKCGTGALSDNGNGCAIGNCCYIVDASDSECQDVYDDQEEPFVEASPEGGSAGCNGIGCNGPGTGGAPGPGGGPSRM